MANPAFRTSIAVGGLKFNAASCNVALSTLHDNMGMPMMGSVASTVSATVDLNDTDNVPFATLRGLFDLANIVTRDKVQDIKITLWIDESRQDAVGVYTFRGWISHFSTLSGDGSNHLLSLSFQPELTQQQFIKIDLTN